MSDQTAKILQKIADVQTTISALNYTNKLISEELHRLNIAPDSKVFDYFNQQGDLMKKLQVTYQNILIEMVDTVSSLQKGEPPVSSFDSLI